MSTLKEEKMRKISITKAITEAIDEEMERDATVFLMGEDVGKWWGGNLGEFQGLFDKYGSERVLDLPISEAANLGGAIGAAANGMRPVVDLMFVDFMGVCGDELINQLQMRYMFGGKVKLPLTITACCGAGACTAAHHSKNMYGWLMAITGLKSVTPSTPYDAKGLFKSAIRENNPVIFFYHKDLLLSGIKGEVPEGEFTVPLGKADIKREGSNVTVVAMGLMVHRALAAADTLQEQGISIEVLDPRTLVPLDKQTIIDSVKKTGKLVIMSEEPVTGSTAGEISAIVADEAFDFLKAPIKRVCAPDTPVPFSPFLEKIWMPDEEDLIKAVTEIM
jgi:pyruvate/2-oxoglutarate/acetoin dehydrogenase E1 component